MMNQTNYQGPGEYVIKVMGHLDERKSYWFEGLTLTTGFDEDDNPITTFSGPLVDQAALHGVLAKIRDMNLPLISVSQVKADSKGKTQSRKEGGPL
jgi:hypothetical protein